MSIDAATESPDDAENEPQRDVEASEDAELSDGAPSREERRDERVRTRLRAAEADSERLRNTLEPFVRAEVERLAADRLSDGSALWILDVSPLAFLNGETNTIDAEKVAAEVDRLIRHAPTLERRRFEGSADGGARQSAESNGDGWSKVLNPK